MILRAFSLLDIKTGIFNVPFFMPHPQMAIRAVVDLMADQNTTIARHPADFALCEIGSYDDQTGMLMPETVQQLGVASSFLPRQSNGPLFEPAELEPAAITGRA